MIFVLIFFIDGQYMFDVDTALQVQEINLKLTISKLSTAQSTRQQFLFHYSTHQLYHKQYIESNRLVAFSIIDFFYGEYDHDTNT